MTVIFFKHPDSDVPSGLLVVDATLGETHRSTMKATSHPIEDGSTVTDHLLVEPPTLEIRGAITDTPIGLLGQLSGATENVVAGIARIVPAGEVQDLVVDQVRSALARSRSAFELLRRLQLEKREVTVITSLKSYSDMVLTSLSVPRGQGDGRAIRFQASFQPILKVSSETLRPEALDREVADQAQDEQDVGRQATDSADPSLFSELLGVLGIIL